MVYGIALALAVLAIVADQAAGLLVRHFKMSHDPAVEVQVNTDSNRTIIVAGGMGNDGIALARAMGEHYLLTVGSVLGIRYAQTNVDTDLLVRVVDEAIDKFGLGDNKFDVYVSSAGGTIMAEALCRLSLNRWLGTVIFDGSPHSADDVKRPLRELLKIHFDVIKHGRILAVLSRVATNVFLEPATDKADDIPLVRTQATRQAIVDADTITLGIQAAAIRRSVPRGLLKNVADDYVYVRSEGSDPLVDNVRALAGWRKSVGPIRAVIDPYRPPDTHAAGGSYPRGAVEIFQGTL